MFSSLSAAVWESGGVLAGSGGLAGVLGGVGGLLSVSTCFGYDMSFRLALGFVGGLPTL